MVYAQMQLWQCVGHLCRKHMLPEAQEMFHHQEAVSKRSVDIDVDVDVDVCFTSGAAAGHSSKRTLSGETDMHVAPDLTLNRTLQDCDVCPTSGVPAGGHGSKRTRVSETDMDNASEVRSNKMPRLAPTVKRDLSGEGRADEATDSSSGSAHDMVLQQQDEGRSKRPRTGAAAHEETQGVNSSSRRADDMKSHADVSPAAHAAEDVELCLRVLNEFQEIEVVTRVGVVTVDLSAHTGLLALPEALRGLTAMRELTVVSTALKLLPEWLGELRGLKVLCVRGEGIYYPKGCPLEALPASLGALTALTTLDLQYCEALTALPESLGALTGLEDLDLSGCRRLKEVPAWVMGLHKLKVPFMEVRLRVMSGDSGSNSEGDGIEMEMVTRVRVDKVDMSAHTGLLALPEALRGLTALRELTVTRTALETLPKWMCELRGLEVLRVRDGGFGHHPRQALLASLGALTMLKTLDLWKCDVLPASLWALTRLNTLNLQDCYKLMVLPASLGALTGLTMLDLGCCKALTVLPASLGALTGMKTLDLKGCKALTALPASFGALTGLTMLDLGYCEALTALPASLGALTGLTTLNLKPCEALTALPASFRALTGLTMLNLECELFTFLPESLGALTALTTLNLARITALPASVGDLTGLTTLHLSWCYDLFALPESLGALTRLTTLHLSDCQDFQVLPESLGALTGLTTLNLQNCASLEFLPASLGTLTGLATLNVNISRLYDIEMLGALIGLTTLDLSCNNLRELPASLGALTALTTLDLGYCGELKALPASLWALIGLTKLNLSDCNCLTALPAELGALTALTTLDLNSCSALAALPASLGSLTGLTRLNLSNCDSLTALPAELGALTALWTLNLNHCSALAALPASLGSLTGLTMLDLKCCNNIMALLASLGLLTALRTLNLEGCCNITALPVSFGSLTALRALNLQKCEALTALPASLGAHTALWHLDLRGCVALHTPPPAIVLAGTRAVLQFLRDLAKGEAPSHLIKVVLLGDQRAGKSSLADSLVLGQPATRAYNDRTVGIEVRRWRLGGQSQLVANIFDAAGQRVYRATHGFFMSSGALFLHVVRCDMPEDVAVAALLKWVEAVQQEAPGAAMGLVWTHVDHFSGLRAKAVWQQGLLCVRSNTKEKELFQMQYLHHHGAPCLLHNVGIANVDPQSNEVRREQEDYSSGAANVMSRFGTNMQGKVALIDLRYKLDRDLITQTIKMALPLLLRAGALGLIIIIHNYYFENNNFQRIFTLGRITPLFSDVASIPIIFIRKMHAETLTTTNVAISALHGARLSCHPFPACLPHSASRLKRAERYKLPFLRCVCARSHSKNTPPLIAGVGVQVIIVRPVREMQSPWPWRCRQGCWGGYTRRLSDRCRLWTTRYSCSRRISCSITTRCSKLSSVRRGHERASTGMRASKSWTKCSCLPGMPSTK